MVHVQHRAVQGHLAALRGLTTCDISTGFWSIPQSKWMWTTHPILRSDHFQRKADFPMAGSIFFWGMVDTMFIKSSQELSQWGSSCLIISWDGYTQDSKRIHECIHKVVNEVSSLLLGYNFTISIPRQTRAFQSWGSDKKDQLPAAWQNLPTIDELTSQLSFSYRTRSAWSAIWLVHGVRSPARSFWRFKTCSNLDNEQRNTYQNQRHQHESLWTNANLHQTLADFSVQLFNLKVVFFSPPHQLYPSRHLVPPVEHRDHVRPGLREAVSGMRGRPFLVGDWSSLLREWIKIVKQLWNKLKTGCWFGTGGN